jgi:hypothetical protein
MRPRDEIKKFFQTLLDKQEAEIQKLEKRYFRLRSKGYQWVEWRLPKFGKLLEDESPGTLDRAIKILKMKQFRLFPSYVPFALQEEIAERILIVALIDEIIVAKSPLWAAMATYEVQCCFDRIRELTDEPKVAKVISDIARYKFFTGSWISNKDFASEIVIPGSFNSLQRIVYGKIILKELKEKNRDSLNLHYTFPDGRADFIRRQTIINAARDKERRLSWNGEMEFLKSIPGRKKNQ